MKGTTLEVVDSFARYDDGGPDRSHGSTRYERMADGSIALFSYSTIVAIRLPDGRYASSLERHSVTTSKLMSRLHAALDRVGLVPTIKLTRDGGSWFQVWDIQRGEG